MVTPYLPPAEQWLLVGIVMAIWIYATTATMLDVVAKARQRQREQEADADARRRRGERRPVKGG